MISRETGPLATLCERFGLSAGQGEQLSAIVAELQADEHAPMANRDRGQAGDLHLADSLAALELDALRRASHIADLGSGAGFPGLALAVALPRASVSLVESQRRKCRFLERTCAVASVENARVVWARAEEWREGVGCQDVVVARALAPAQVALEYAAPLLRVGGALIDWRGKRDARAEANAACAAEQLGMRPLEIRHIKPYADARDHHLHVYEKVAETPSRFPRRAGIARKRPLGC